MPDSAIQPASAEHPPWCSLDDAPGWPVHASETLTVPHGATTTLGLSLYDYGADAGTVVSIDITTDLDTLVLDLTTAEARELSHTLAELLIIAGDGE